MKIICAGLCKTGTKTIDTALDILGYRVSDVTEQGLQFLDEWHELIMNGKLPDLKTMLKDIDTVSDIPACFFFEEILAAFPEAKVILMTRDEDSWADSWRRQLEEFASLKRKTIPFQYLSPTWSKFLALFTGVVQAAFGSDNPQASVIHRHSFRMHNDRVRATVPKDQLLEYSVKQGWKPLCEFLECEIPPLPFPHENKGQSKRLDRPERGHLTSKAGIRMGKEIVTRLVLFGGLILAAVFVYQKTKTGLH